ncbi:hypothetical protein B0H65DRAFT_467835 [Neurospora tetraspora]|uniref:Uncharacterized protein n=1 Tax=Neurospora tetraspora TaxID=94610 RepID=A0AAE0JBT6_9PEZI|nr:hypothetical protein B0H65DRAFT_467835 [Neurospora tetraspora]
MYWRRMASQQGGGQNLAKYIVLVAHPVCAFALYLPYTSGSYLPYLYACGVMGLCPDICIQHSDMYAVSVQKRDM